MVKGVQGFTIRDYLGNKEQFIESIKRVKNIGYDCMQLGVPAFMEPGEVKSLVDEIGIEICTVYGSYEKMAEDPEAIKKAVSDAKIFGTDLVAIGTLPEEMRDCRDGFKRFADSMNKIARELLKDDCKLIYHNHALEFYSLGGGEHGMNILLNDTDPSCVWFSLDTHWLASGGVDPVEWIYKVKGRMPLIHFKDYAIGGGVELIEGVNKMFAEVGEGNINWLPIVKACHETGIKYAIVEQDTCKGNPFDSLEISYKNMVKFNV